MESSHQLSYHRVWYSKISIWYFQKKNLTTHFCSSDTLETPRILSKRRNIYLWIWRETGVSTRNLLQNGETCRFCIYLVAQPSIPPRILRLKTFIFYFVIITCIAIYFIHFLYYPSINDNNNYCWPYWFSKINVQHHNNHNDHMRRGLLVITTK